MGFWETTISGIVAALISWLIIYFLSKKKKKNNYSKNTKEKISDIGNVNISKSKLKNIILSIKTNIKDKHENL